MNDGAWVARMIAARRTYALGSTEVGLWDASLSVSAGDFVAIVGPSGSGKSTALNLLGLLDRADSGTVELFGLDADTVSSRERADMRARHISFVFQSFHLSEQRSVLENVTDGMLFSHRLISRTKPAKEALELVGLANRATQRVATLSGGERQRVAIARALAKQPDLLLADEPTGNLDSANGHAVLELLKTAANTGTAVVMVTHDSDLAAEANRVVRVVDGRTYSSEVNAT